MNKISKLINLGSSAGIIIPKMFLLALNIAKEDMVTVELDLKKNQIIIKKK